MVVLLHDCWWCRWWCARVVVGGAVGAWEGNCRRLMAVVYVLVVRRVCWGVCFRSRRWLWRFVGGFVGVPPRVECCGIIWYYGNTRCKRDRFFIFCFCLFPFFPFIGSYNFCFSSFSIFRKLKKHKTHGNTGK